MPCSGVGVKKCLLIPLSLHDRPNPAVGDWAGPAHLHNWMSVSDNPCPKFVMPILMDHPGHKQVCPLEWAVWEYDERKRLLCRLFWPRPSQLARYSLDLIRFWRSHFESSPAGEVQGGHSRRNVTPVPKVVGHSTFTFGTPHARQRTSYTTTSSERLLGVISREAGSWLHALPVSTLGNPLDNESLQIAISLRLGIPVGMGHNCVAGDGPIN